MGRYGESHMGIHFQDQIHYSMVFLDNIVFCPVDLHYNFISMLISCWFYLFTYMISFLLLDIHFYVKIEWDVTFLLAWLCNCLQIYWQPSRNYCVSYGETQETLTIVFWLFVDALLSILFCRFKWICFKKSQR